MNGQRIGYVRVSTSDQNTGRQLEDVGLDKVFVDHASGKDRHRPQLEALLQYAREGDTVYVHSIDRLARNLMDLRAIVEGLTKRGVALTFVKEGISFAGSDSPISTLMLSMMGAFAEFERAVLLERQREGIALAKKAGKYQGGRPVLTLEQVKQVQGLAEAGVPKTRIAQRYGVSRATVYNYLHLQAGS